MRSNVIIGFFMLLFCALPVAAQQKTLIFHSNHYPLLNNQTQTGFLDQLTQEILKRNGFAVEISFLPPKRAFVNLNRYLASGNSAKIAGLEASYPHVRQVPEKMIEISFVAFTLLSNPQVKSWQDLYQYDVGIVTGMKIVETHLKDHPRLTKVVVPEQLFQILELGRVDYIVFTYWNGLAYAQQLNLKDRLKMAQPPLAIADMFMYVNDQYESLVPALAKTLLELKADGTYQRLFETTLLPFQQQFKLE